MSRIIAGTHRGRRLTMPATGRTRPTTDRVREALFSALASWAGTAGAPTEESLAGLSFCDLFAGSGAVGLEAASRGAAPVLLVEADRRTATTAKDNASSLRLPARVTVAKVEQLVRAPIESAFDVIFADPPYELAGPKVEGVLAAVLENGWLAPDGLVVVERSRRTPELTWPPGFPDHWLRRYGETLLCFGRPTDGAEPAAEGSA